MSGSEQQVFSMELPSVRRGRPPGSRTIPEKIEQLWDLHHEISRMLLLGMKNTVIAEQLGCTPQTVSNVRNSPVIKEKLSLMNGARDAETLDLTIRIRDELAPKALAVMEEILDDDTTAKGLRVKICDSILDRAGYKPTTKMDITSRSMILTGEDIERIKEKALAQGMAGGMVVDVTPQEG